MGELVTRCENLMLDADRPLTKSEIAAALGIRRESVLHIKAKLNKKYGNRFIEEPNGRATGEMQYSIEGGSKLKRHSSLPSESELFRGWVNPATGIVPPCLGLKGYRR